MTTLDDWARLADEIKTRAEIFIGGDFRSAASGATFDSVNPATGDLIAAVSSADAVDVDAAVASARAAFEAGSWSQTSAGHRKKVLRRLAGLINDHSQELALLDSMDMGKLAEEAHNVDVPSAADLFEFYGEAIDKRGGEVAPTEPGNLALVTREPLGVIGAVTPWNFPLDLAVWKVAPALAAGNSVVLKPAEQAPLSSIRLAELAAEAGLRDPSRCGRSACGHGVGQHRRRPERSDAVRRLQTIRVRLRPVAARARQVHRAEDHLDRILKTTV